MTKSQEPTAPTLPGPGGAATDVCDAAKQDCSACPFDIDIDLVSHTNGTILTPFLVPDYSEGTSGTTDNKDFVKFEIEVEENAVASMDIVITVGEGTARSTLYSETLSGGYLAVGTHAWNWDGYSNAGILDTRVLKDETLTLWLIARNCGETKSESIEFDNEESEQDWMDVVIDKGAKTVDIHLRTELDDGGEDGVGEWPPDEVQESAIWATIPAGDIRRQRHVRTRDFAALKALALGGLDKYWSRNAGNGLTISTPAGRYTATMHATSTEDDSMDDISLEYNANGSWGRASNPGSIRGFFSFFANIFVPERTIYNAGWIEYDGDVWLYHAAGSDDDEFAHTAAHEIGHEILSAYGGEGYSYSHRGSSTVVTQSTLEPVDGGFTYPAGGEIDLMKYYNGTRPPDHDFFRRSVASEQDVKSLVWLARVEFDD